MLVNKADKLNEVFFVIALFVSEVTVMAMDGAMQGRKTPGEKLMFF